MAALAQSAREHLKRARLIGKSLDLRMAAKSKPPTTSRSTRTIVATSR
jgi:hypothetical protein